VSGGGRRGGPRLDVRALVAFFALAYALSWLWVIPLAAAHLVVVQRGVGWPTHLPALLGPAIAAVVVTAWTMGRPGVRDLGARMARWRVPLRWWLAAVSPLVFLGLGLAAMAMAGKAPPSVGDFGRFSGITAIGLAGVLLIIFGGAVGKETGWPARHLGHQPPGQPTPAATAARLAAVTPSWSATASPGFARGLAAYLGAHPAARRALGLPGHISPGPAGTGRGGSAAARCWSASTLTIKPQNSHYSRLRTLHFGIAGRDRTRLGGTGTIAPPWCIPRSGTTTHRPLPFRCAR
jgi:hypothetical protein